MFLEEEEEEEKEQEGEAEEEEDTRMHIVYLLSCGTSFQKK